MKAAWNCGDPGLLYLDAMNAANPTPHVGKLETTNPCGEVPLLPYEACNLGSINLAHMLHIQSGQVKVNWEKLRKTTRLAIRFLDNVIEINHYPLADIERMSRGNRKVGLGVMGFAEFLIQLGIPYDSEQALNLAEKLMGFIHQEAQAMSRVLAEERGVYPFWKGSIHQQRQLKQRNATVTAIAPTGTLSLIANTSSGIEPLFALAYRQSHVLEERSLQWLNAVFLNDLNDKKIDQAEIL